MTLSDAVIVIYQLLPEPQAGLLAGMIFGVKTNLSEALYEALIQTGTLHIIALSGMNISILIGFVTALLVRICRRPIANTLACGIIIGFVWFVGPSPSIIRAAIMGFLSLLAISFGRQYAVLISWFVAVGGMLLVHPAWITELSFQLSAMATFGIILFGSDTAKPIYPQSVFQHIRGALAADLRVTLAAQVFTIPIILFAFGRISLVSPLSNVLIGWLIAPAMVMGLALVVLGLVWYPLAVPLAWIVWVPLTAIIASIEATARVPFASISL